jgi:hypothetical protein
MMVFKYMILPQILLQGGMLLGAWNGFYGWTP